MSKSGSRGQKTNRHALRADHRLSNLRRTCWSRTSPLFLLRQRNKGGSELVFRGTNTVEPNPFSLIHQYIKRIVHGMFNDLHKIHIHEITELADRRKHDCLLCFPYYLTNNYTFLDIYTRCMYWTFVQLRANSCLTFYVASHHQGCFLVQIKTESYPALTIYCSLLQHSASLLQLTLDQ